MKIGKNTLIQGGAVVAVIALRIAGIEHFLELIKHTEIALRIIHPFLYWTIWGLFFLTFSGLGLLVSRKTKDQWFWGGFSISCSYVLFTPLTMRLAGMIFHYIKLGRLL